MGGGLHVVANSPTSGVGSPKGFTTNNIELQDIAMNHPCNVKVDNLGSSYGGKQAMRIHDPIEFLVVGVDEKQPLKAIDMNVRNVVMEDKKQELWVLT